MLTESSFNLLYQQKLLNSLLKNPEQALSSKSLFTTFTSMLHSSKFRVQVTPQKRLCQLCSSPLNPDFISLDCSHCLCSFTCFEALINIQLQGNLEKYSHLTCPCSSKISRSVTIRAYGGQEKFTEALKLNCKLFEPKFTCSICTEVYPISDFRTLDCDHRFCLNCIKMAVEFLIDEGKVKNELVCPECKMEIEPNIVINLINEATREKYEDFCLMTIDPLPGERYVRCVGVPGVNCKFAQIVSVDRDEYECRECGARFCPKCKLEPHPKMTCEQKEAFAMADNDFVRNNLQSGVMKICPWCLTPAMKDDACKYVTCDAKKQGEHFFCWECLKKLSTKHENHKCVARDTWRIRLGRFFRVL